MKVQDEATALYSLEGLTTELPKLQSFQEFRKIGKCSVIVFIFNFAFSFCYAPFYLIDHYYYQALNFEDDKVGAVLHSIQLFFLISAIICSWVVLAWFQTKDSHRLLLRRRIKATFVISLNLFFSLHVVSSLLVFADDPSYKNGYAIAFAAILLILFPPAAFEVFRVTENWILLVCWGLTVLAFVSIVVVAPTSNSIVVLLAYLLLSVLVLLDRYYFTSAVYEYNAHLEKRIEQYTKEAMEKKAQEMRGLIANLAHDLKTPLTSFMTAIEMIEIDVSNCAARIPAAEAELGQIDIRKIFGRMQQSSEYILVLLQSIREIHAFMLMMINRSIDFKKASAGINLVPCIETIDLSTIVMMPVRCMQNMQQKIGVRYEGIRGEIHPWIKTDQQWLQENLLCLLSNAVKYSMCGEVELCILVQKAESLKKVAGKVVDEVQVKRNRNSTYDVKEEDSYFSGSSQNKPQTSRFTFSSPRFRRFSTSTYSRHQPLQKEENSSYSSPGSKSKPDFELESPDILLTPVVSDLESREFLLFEVKDRGPGLSDKAMSGIFNPFKQSRLSGGTGLGLYSLAKRIESLGGQYGIHPREDGQSGSVIWFTIPFIPVTANLARTSSPKSNAFNAQKAVIIPPPVTKSSTSVEKTDHYSESPCILVVDDSPTIVKMTCMMLKKQNIDTDIAENGKIALEKVIASYSFSSSTSPSTSSPARKYAAVLMDFQMPEMDGIEATKRIREYESQHGIECPLCIIGISAMSDSALIEEGKAKGMTAFVPKPFANKDFLSFIRGLKQK